jgi:hypothetical protein
MDWTKYSAGAKVVGSSLFICSVFGSSFYSMRVWFLSDVVGLSVASDSVPAEEFAQ